MYERAQQVLQPFIENKAFMEDRINAGIELYRKGWAKIQVLDAEGNPVPDAHVEIRQKSHDFRFGANLFMLDELETPEKNEEYKKRFCELFNIATIPFYWSDLEPEQGKPRFDKDSPKVYRRPAPDLCIDFCREHDIEPRLHCLVYDQWSPMWLPNDVPTVKKYLEKRIAEIAERYRDVIPTMEVINETLRPKFYLPEENRHSTNFFDEPDLVEWSFEHSRKYLPTTKLIINESPGYAWGNSKRKNHFAFNRCSYYMQIERALAKGASIDSIGMHFHMFNGEEPEAAYTKYYYNPHNLYAVMDRYADFGKPLQVTEITIPAYSNNPEDEQVQADIITNLYRIWFSHPNMEAIIYWNLVDGYAAFAPQGDMSYGENYYYGALLRFDLSPKPAFFALKKLIHETWNTKLSLESDGDGCVDLKGFYGMYDVEITTKGKKISTSMHLKKGEANRFTFQI